MTAAEWWRDAVIYQIYPRSFSDSDGDGIGDLTGIRQRLAHVVALGADAVWLSPFYRSPMNDAGYDVSDYRAVDPIFGTDGDVELLVREAHTLGLRVLIDIVPNHTSSEHSWFAEALAAGPPPTRGEPRFRHDEGPWGRYHLVRGEGDGSEPPNNWLGNFGGAAWSQVPDAAGDASGWWYLHLFDPTQPDLNWNSAEVRAEFEDVLRFWFDRGVDGFRVDVAHGLVKADGYPDSPAPTPDDPLPGVLSPRSPHYDQPGVHAIYRSWREVADSYSPPRVFVGEVWVSSAERLAAYIRPDELHTAFNFDHLRAPWWAPGLRASIDGSIAAAEAVGAPCTWVLENHDVWRAPTRYAPVIGDADGSGFQDLLDRAPTHLDARDLATGLRRARAALLVMLALPGSAYVYQGQELGLPEVLDLPAEARQDPTFRLTGGAAIGRDGCRVPIPWSGDQPAYGFGPQGSAASWLPQPAEWADLSVEAQQSVDHSTLELSRSALMLRRTLEALGDGILVWDEHALGSTVLSFVRPARDGGRAMRCVIAIEGDEVELPVAWGSSDSVLLTSGESLRINNDRLRLPADTAVWLTV